MSDCPACRAHLESALVCSSCDRLVPHDRAPSPFGCFGLEPSYALDAADLRKRLLRFSRKLHPDYFANSNDAERALAEQSSAELNAAFDVLSDDAARAEWLVANVGGVDEQAERSMPQAFLLEVLDWNETLEAAREAPRGSDARATIDELTRTLSARRVESLNRVGAALAAIPERGSPRWIELRRELNALRYLDRALEDLRALALDQAQSPH